MKLTGAIFDLDGTLTDSMYIWNEAPKALVRQFGGEPPEDLPRTSRRWAAGRPPSTWWPGSPSPAPRSK